jgi:hypothetical protein
MTAGFLRSPRVRVLWGSVNLSAYDGPKHGAPEVFALDSEKGGPIVYDVEVNLSAEGDGPTASMKWDPTAPAFAAYEWFISQPDYMRTQITIEYFYPQGKRVVFSFVWSGQSINYGNDMSVTVKMVSELAGLINGNLRNTAQAYDEKKGASALSVYSKTQEQFGLKGFPKLLQFSKASEAYAKKAKIASSYGKDMTFGSNIANLSKQTGDAAMGINIGTEASVVIFGPFSYKGGAGETVVNAATLTGATLPDPTIRYGYILGPSIINSIQRTSEWKPPQQDNNKTTAGQPKLNTPQTSNTTLQSPPPAPAAAQANTQAAAARTSSPIGTANNRTSPGIQNADNPEAPDRQRAMNDEKSSKLSMQTMMCPMLVGVKPYDILYVPSLTGKFIEDWIVQSVGYSQDNGNVTVNIEATRVLGLGTAMNEKAKKDFETFAKSKNLIGPNASLDAWDAYAWGSAQSAPGAPVPSAADPTKLSNNSILQQQARELRASQAASRARQGR